MTGAQNSWNQGLETLRVFSPTLSASHHFEIMKSLIIYHEKSGFPELIVFFFNLILICLEKNQRIHIYIS